MAAGIVPIMKWIAPPIVMIPGVDFILGNLDGKVQDTLVRNGVKMEEHGKQHHVWQNRTFEAESTLYHEVTQDGHIHRLKFSHGVYYGIYLERMQAGRFSVIMNTMQMFYADIMDDLRAVIG